MTKRDGTHWSDIRQRIAEGVSYGPYRLIRRPFQLNPVGMLQAYSESVADGEEPSHELGPR